MNEIMCFIDCYLKLKDDYKEYNKENIFNVFNIFTDEVYELKNIVSEIDGDNFISIIDGDSPVNSIISKINIYEEELLNEIADVLFTTARLIKEFNLQEPLIEMMEYKYHRQLIREEKKKNEGLK